MKRDWIVDKSDLILVTGANGFVGSRVVKILLEQGFTRIRCLVRSMKNTDELNSLCASSEADVEFIEGNLLAPEDCRRAVKDVLVIFHLAAGRGKSFAACFMDSAVATRNLLDAVLSEGILIRFVGISSLSVHSSAHLRRGDLLDETCPIETEHMARFDPYCYGKVKQDELLIDYGLKYGLKYTIVRPGVVYGPGKRLLIGRIGVDSFGLYLHVGGRNRLPIIYVDNCAEAIVLSGIIAGIDGEVFIAVDDDLPTSRQHLRAYKKEVGYFHSIYIPYPVFYCFCWLWEKYSRWSEGQLPPVLNRIQCAVYYRAQLYSNLKLKKLTGWRSRVPFDEAMRRFFEFMHKEVGC